MAESAAALVDVLTRVSMEEVVMIACFVVPLLSLVHTTLLACGLSTMASASEATAEVANCAADAAAPTPQAHQLDGKPLLTEGHPRSHDDEEKGVLLAARSAELSRSSLFDAVRAGLQFLGDRRCHVMCVICAIICTIIGAAVCGLTFIRMLPPAMLSPLLSPPTLPPSSPPSPLPPPPPPEPPLSPPRPSLPPLPPSPPFTPSPPSAPPLRDVGYWLISAEEAFFGTDGGSGDDARPGTSISITAARVGGAGGVDLAMWDEVWLFWILVLMWLM